VSKTDVLVIGGGAAGIMAAFRAGQLGASVTLLEKTKQLGTKILISGGGKCNVAHDGPLEDVIKAFRKNEAIFLRPSCYQLPNHRIIELMRAGGLEVYTRPDGRVFPVTQTARDVVAILMRYLESVGVRIELRSPVVKIEVENGHLKGVWTGNAPRDQSGYRARAVEATHFWPANVVVLATGGSSYPNSGTTGDGWEWAKAMGHHIVPVRAALAPIYLEITPSRVQLSGVALRNILVKARSNSKEVARWRGDLLFTHQGLSGPTILGISREVAEQIHPVSIFVDLAPETNQDELHARMGAMPVGTQVLSFVAEYLPESVALEFLRDMCSDPRGRISQLDRKSRNRVVEGLKSWNLGVVRAVPLEKGECVAGGISLDEVEPKTMQSRRVSGLFIAGEVLDVAGPVGGYNLQAAFATGWQAGESAARFSQGLGPP
jgi:predicted Rossmann fold flavoprotein